MSATAPAFVGLFTKDEATAAQRTFVFFAPDATDGFTAEPGLTYAGADNQISKNGGAFGNLAGAVTEIAGGFYQVVLDAADLDTLGTFVITFADAAARTVQVCGQVIALDLNTATVALTAASITSATFAAGAIDAAAIADGAIDAATLAADTITAAKIASDALTAAKFATGCITAAKFAAGAIDAAAIAADAITNSELAATAVTEIQSGLATTAAVSAITSGQPVRNRYADCGDRTTDGNFTPQGVEDMATGYFTVTGTWDGATATAYHCPDPTATVPAWVALPNPITANGTIALTGPLKAVRVTLSGSGAGTSLACDLAVRRY